MSAYLIDPIQVVSFEDISAGYNTLVPLLSSILKRFGSG